MGLSKAKFSDGCYFLISFEMMHSIFFQKIHFLLKRSKLQSIKEIGRAKLIVAIPFFLEQTKDVLTSFLKRGCVEFVE